LKGSNRTNACVFWKYDVMKQSFGLLLRKEKKNKKKDNV
jgi:hypothetical protein